MNGEDVRVNGNGLMSGSSNMAEGEVDPDILAAIAASKQDHHEEEDPAVLAAIEASKQEVAGTGDNSAKVVEEEPKKESKGPILMFSTLGRSTEPYDEDDTFDSHVTEEEPTEEEEEAGKEEVADDDGDVAEPGDLDPDDAELPAAELDDGEEVGGAGVGEGGKKKKEDFLTPTLRRAYITKVKPEKRYCSSDEDSDGDWGGSKKKKKKGGAAKKAAAAPAQPKKAAVAAVGPSTVFKSPYSNLTFETIGQLNVHKHSAHGEDKPSVLDMSEAVIARLQEKAGAPKDKILKEILSEFTNVIEDATKVTNQLGIALVEGIEFGRLRQGTSGKKNWNNYWLQENAKKRKTMMDKWLKDPASVGDASTSGGEVTVNIIENSGEFVAIKEKLEKYNIQVTTSVKKPDPPKQPPTKGAKKRFDDDDDIEIVSEKITQKTKMKIAQKKKMAKMKPKAVIKVNSAQGKQMLKTIAKTGKVPKSLSSSSTSSSTTSIFSSSSGFGDDDEEEEDNLNCPTCFSAFWYPSQTFEHMKSVHNIENPEKYMKEKKRQRK